MSNTLSVKQNIKSKEWIPLMYIRQECIFPFDEILKFQPESRLQAVLAQLNFEKLAEGLAKPEHTRGSKGHNPLTLLYSFIAMQLEKINITRDG